MAEDSDNKGFSPTLVLIAVALAVTLLVNVAERKALAANKWQGPVQAASGPRGGEGAQGRCIAVDPMGTGIPCRPWQRRAESKPGQG